MTHEQKSEISKLVSQEFQLVTGITPPPEPIASIIASKTLKEFEEETGGVSGHDQFERWSYDVAL